MIKTVSKTEALELTDFDLGSSEWLQVSQPVISAFATLTKDEQFIHVDSEKARSTPFGGTIAHGFLVMSLLSHFASQSGITISDTKMAVNYGFDKVRFIAPVPNGAEVRGNFTVHSVTEKTPGQLLLKYDVQVEIKGQDKPALIAEWLVLAFVK